MLYGKKYNKLLRGRLVGFNNIEPESVFSCVTVEPTGNHAAGLCVFHTGGGFTATW